MTDGRSWLDWMFRPQCAACGALAVTLCEACRASLVELGPACPRCAEPFAGPEPDDGDELETELEEPEAGGGLIADRGAVEGQPGGSAPDGPEPGGDDTQAEVDGVAAPTPVSSRREPTQTTSRGGVAGCRRCARVPLQLDGVVAPWRFGGQLAEAIRRLKFGNRAHIARDIAPLWAPALAAAVTEHDALVVPVPLHWRRRWRRGYDHAWLLARHACAAVGLAGPATALRRVRHRPAQSTLPAAERAANVAGAFAISRGWTTAVAGRAVVLVDDVMTIGATLAEAARTLRAAGAAQVTALVLARATFARE